MKYLLCLCILMVPVLGYPCTASPSPSPTATPWYYPATYTLVAGVHDSGDLSDVQEKDDTRLVFEETATTPGLEVIFHFKNIPSNRQPGCLLNMDFQGYYDGNPSHIIVLCAYDFVSEIFERVTEAAKDFPDESSDQDYTFNLAGVLDSNNFQSNQLWLRICHLSKGVANDFFRIDYMALAPTPDPNVVAPTGVDASDGDYYDKIVITWDEEDTATSYTVYYGTDEINFDNVLTVTEDEIATHTVGYDETHYFYRVVGVAPLCETTSTLYSEGYASTFSLCFNTVAWWKMDDNTANTTVEDSIGGYDGTFTDVGGDPNTDAHTTPGVSGITSPSLIFDGVDDYVPTTDDILGGMTSMSLSLWFNNSSLVANSTICAQYVGAGNRTLWVRNNATSGLSIQLWDSAGGDAGIGIAGFIETSTWYHLVITYDGTEAFSYIDTILKNSDNTIASPLDTCTDDFTIGSKRSGSAANVFNGDIDDVRIFNRVITADEIAALYNEGKGSRLCEPRIIGPYPLGYDGWYVIP